MDYIVGINLDRNLLKMEIYKSIRHQRPMVKISVLLNYIIKNFCYLEYLSPNTTYTLGCWLHALSECELFENASLLPF